MVNSTSILYSKSAAARLMGVAVDSIKGFAVWAKVAWVWVKGSRPKFMSLKAFKQHFVDHRKEAAKDLIPQYSSMINAYMVKNPRKDSQYICTPTERKDLAGNWHFGIECACDDYKNQISFFGHGACKHGYAVLSVLGFDSLRDWTKAQEAKHAQ